MNKKLVKDICSTNDLPELYMTIASLIGLENTLLLAGKLGGESVYFPRLTSLNRYARNRRIQEEFTGYNIRSLAKKHHISIRRVQQIVKDIKPKDKGKKSADRRLIQPSLFDI
ncbi:Mor transcription activator family protein [Desulfocucumis palustris]|uniref:Mor transcription activator family protein n=1 Tax=Desulfocucumis palustris TaxID=1898651 RepID=UPI000CE9AE96|nr:Mor transcription activator family protein [Desulfocucumis palustris]